MLDEAAGWVSLGGLSGWALGPVVAAASAGSGLRSLGSFRRCLVCAAWWWGGGSAAWGIVGLRAFPPREFLETEQSAINCSLVFKVRLCELFGCHGIVHDNLDLNHLSIAFAASFFFQINFKHPD